MREGGGGIVKMTNEIKAMKRKRTDMQTLHGKLCVALYEKLGGQVLPVMEEFQRSPSFKKYRTEIDALMHISFCHRKAPFIGRHGSSHR